MEQLYSTSHLNLNPKEEEDPREVKYPQSKINIEGKKSNDEAMQIDSQNG